MNQRKKNILLIIYIWNFTLSKLTQPCATFVIGNMASESMEKISGNLPLKVFDKELYDLINQEKRRQKQTIELIASENFTSRAVMECLGSCLTNKYSEGYSGARYYGGNEIIDQIENLCQTRCLNAFKLSPDEWGVNVQPYSGSPANFAVYTGLMKPHDRIMGLDLFSGGHLTHGFYSSKRKVSASSIYFESLPYKVKDDGLIDYDELHKEAKLFRPRIIIAGYSAYPRDLDYKRFYEIAADVGSYLMADMSHFAGLIAAGLLNSPFKYCDVVTTTVHKTLRGPRSGLIFYNKAKVKGIEQFINEAVFPGIQGGPHNHQIAAIATQMKEIATDSWKEYARQIIVNCKILAEYLMERNYKIVTGGTDNHMLLWDLRPHNLTGSQMQLVCDMCGITLNKNTIHGDVSALNPSGVRIGTPSMTTRNVNGEDWKTIGDFLHRCVLICQDICSVFTISTLLYVEWSCRNT